MSMTPFKSANYNSQSVNNLTQDEIDVLDGSIAGLAVANKVLIPDDNLDLSGIRNLNTTCVVAGWSALGCTGWNQTASFAHRDLNTTSQFALLHSAGGEVRLNATNSQNISLCINDLIEHLQVRGSTGEVIIGVASEVPSPNAMLHLHGDKGHGLSMYADYPIEVAPTDDVLCKFGKASVGYLGSAGFTGFSHNDTANATDFAIQQSLTGTTIVNAAAGENLWLSTGGIPIISLASNGNFGVGNLSPDEKLDVAGNVKVSGDINCGVNLDISCNFGKAAIGFNGVNPAWASFGYVGNLTQTEYALMAGNSGNTKLNCSGSGSVITFRENDATKMTLSGGLFGIGILEPAEKLDVGGNVKVSGLIEAGLNTDIICKFGRVAIGYMHGAGDLAGFSHIDSNNTTGYALTQSSAGLTQINSTGGTGIEFSHDNNFIAMFKFGDFGIGTGAPAEKLDVVGNIKASGTIEAGLDLDLTSKFGKVALGSFAFNNWAGFAHIDNNNATDYALLQSDSGTTVLNATGATGIVFKINDVEGARLAIDGNFGIGTDTPSTKLEVVGDISCSGDIDWLDKPPIVYYPVGGAPAYPPFFDAVRKIEITSGINVVGEINSITAAKIAEDKDLTSIIGKAAIGYVGFADWSGFSHIDTANSTDFALIQNAVGSTIINAASTKSIGFKINNSEKARVHSDGNFGINTNAPTEKLEVVGNILASGTIVSSDDRLKHNEVNIITGLDIIRQLVPQTYDKTLEMRDEDFNGVIDTEFHKESGFIAQEISAISDLSYCVSGGDYLDASDNTVAKPYNVNYNNIFTYGIAATKELDAIVSAQAIIIAAQASTIATQASTLAAFEIRLAALET